jgi:hypothetical protein
METVSYNKIDYISVDYVFNNAPIYSKTCRGPRDLIRKKNINDFIYLRQREGKWILSDGKSMKFDKIFIKKDIINNIPELNNDAQDKITDDSGIQVAPHILDLEDNEMFKDVDGNLLNIEVRGERKSDKCFFKVKDVSEAFDMPNLQNIIIKENTMYDNQLHYKYFICEKKNNLLKNTTKKELFLTYNGMLKVLFSSRTGNAETFQKWATETLFTVQMGEEEDKDSLAASLLGTTYKVIKQVFRCSSKTTPCIYLLVVKEEGEKLICKYGFSKDLVRRMKEHKTLFKKEFGKEPTLLYYSIIDIKHMSEAENDISGYFCNNKYEYGSMEELVIINKSDLNQVKMVYQCIENKYIGRYEEIKNEVNELKLEIVELNNKLKNSVTDHNHELEILNKKHNHELQMLKNKYDSELQMLKNKYDSEMEMLKNKNELELYKKDIEITSLKDKHLIEMQQKDIDILKKEVDILRKYK